MAEPVFDVGLGLEGTHVLITGSSGAIGRVVVQAFLSTGALVSGLDLVKAEIAGQDHRFQSLVADVTDELQIQASFKQARDSFGVVSVVVVAAGLDLSYAPRNPLVNVSLADWRKVMRVNVDGTFLTCREWLRGLTDLGDQARNLSAVVFGSEAGRFGVASCAAYAASKAAIQVGLVQSIARDAVDIHPDIRVNAIAPGPVMTEQFMKECSQDKDAFWREAQATVALARPVALEAVARACLFLASDQFSGSITGQCLPIDCGKQGNLFWPAKRAMEDLHVRV